MVTWPSTFPLIPSQFLPTLIATSVIVTLISAAAIAIFKYNKRRARLVTLLEKIPGPPALPLIGNSIELNVEHDELLTRINIVSMLFNPEEGIVRAWLGTEPWVILNTSEAAEIILSSNKHIDKSSVYSYLHPWLGTGLLTSAGQKWHSRRKTLTPAFHFRILDEFIDVFHEQSQVLAKNLEKEEVQGQPFNIFPYITLCTLDIICETAMGQTVNAQGNSESEYVKAITKISSIIQNRQIKMWLKPNWLFRMTKYYNEHERCIKILHGFSNKVIRERKEEFLKMKQNSANTDNDKETVVVLGQKKRLAFLDLLIELSQNGSLLTNEDIREEVDTFMFEGHDTTSAAISWVLFLIGSHPEIQDKVMDELDRIFGNDENRQITMKDLQEMRYLECCIKEALRLYPSVPLIARYLKEDVQIAGYTIPAEASVLIATYPLHRNPDTWPSPEKFNPDNFLPEKALGRHPFAYIPFSAGPRNCIGQKFAMLEEKAVVSSVLRKYRIKAVDRREDLTLLGELILRPKDGLRVQVYPRKNLHQ